MGRDLLYPPPTRRRPGCWGPILPQAAMKSKGVLGTGPTLPLQGEGQGAGDGTYSTPTRRRPGCWGRDLLYPYKEKARVLGTGPDLPLQGEGQGAGDGTYSTPTRRRPGCWGLIVPLYLWPVFLGSAIVQCLPYNHTMASLKTPLEKC